MDYRNETPLAEEIRACTGEFHPKTRAIWERYAPEEYWYGELLLHTYRSLTDEGDAPISAAAGVELFRAYGLTRERSPEVPPDDVTGCDSATLLAGDRLLSTSFARISSEHGEAETLQQAIRMVSHATRRLGAGLEHDGGFGASGLETGEKSAPVVTGAVTGQLVVDLARVLSGTDHAVDAPALTAAGSSVGIAVAKLSHGSSDSRIVMDTDGGHHPTDQWLGTSIRECIASARRQFARAYETVPPSVATYLDQLETEADTFFE